MDSNIPTSFIPKRPVTSDTVSTKHSRSTGLLSLLAGVIVIATIISFVGVFIYGQGLSAQKAKLDASLSAARDGLGTEFVTDMKRLNARIDGVKVLLNKHIVVSPIFSALQATTLRSIQYKAFTYTFTSDQASQLQMVNVAITGTAKTYATLALQSDAFLENPVIKNPVFSALIVDEKSSQVGFKLTFDVDPQNLSYQTFINALNGTTAAPVVSGTINPRNLPTQ